MAKIGKFILLLSVVLLTFFSFSIAEEPITVYLTWQRNPESTMTIHWITPISDDSGYIEYQKNSDPAWVILQGKHMKMPENYPYWIHSIELTGLQPDTEYFFKTSKDGKSYKFRTMSNDPDKPIRFAVGGDIYHDGLDILEKMNRQVAKQDPSFVIAGGDLAYNEDKKTKRGALRWLEWLIAWKNQMVAPDGRLIPIIPAIGNHDVEGGFDQTPAKSPFFYALFSFPGLQGYQVLDFGKVMSLFILDSGHTHRISGAQTQWLMQALKQRNQVPHKFAVYHVAAYPSVRSYSGRIQTQIRKLWSPLFENYGINIAFEHHDHAYKRTKLLKNGKENANGVLYIGDGGWGVEKPRVPRNPKNTPYLAKALSSRNVIIVTVKSNQRHLIAINDNGQIIDEVINKSQ